MKDAEEIVLRNTCSIFITTCAHASSKLIRKFGIQRVIIDEATQASELETFLCVDQAK